MAPLTKDTEVGSAQDSQAKSQQEKGAPGLSHADAVSLEVPVKVHGSRVTQAAGSAPRTEPFEEQTSTMIIFSRGGVVKMSSGVNVGQMLVLTNLKSRQDAICRVVKVRSFPNMQGYVEVEFTHPQPGYWGVYFPSESSGSAKSAPAPAPAPQSDAKPKHELEVSWAPAPPSSAAPSQIAPPPASYSKPSKPAATPSVTPKPTSPFAAIGTQEKVQPAAAATLETKSTRPLPKDEFHAPESPVMSLPPEPIAAPSAQALDELLGTADPTFAATTALVAQSTVEESLAPAHAHAHPVAAAAHTTHASTESFGARLDVGLSGSENHPAAPRQNWVLIAACIAVVFVAAAAGIFYFRPKAAVNHSAPATVPVATQQSSPSSAPQQPVSEPASSRTVERVSEASRVPPSPSSAANAGAPASSAARSLRETKPEPKPSESSASASNASAPATEPAKPSVAPEMLASTLNAHPVSSQRSVSTNDAAPSLNPMASGGPGELPGVASSSLAPPPPAPEAPVRVGGEVKEPKLVSSVMPAYPAIAKQAHVTGDVVVDTQIDKTGHVSHMKVVAGPTPLRQAALDALRKWRYEPSTLDGQPVSVDMLVTIRFRP